MLNKEEIESKGKQIEGAMKEKAGLVTNPDLEAQAKAQGLEVKVQERVTQVPPDNNDPLEKGAKLLPGSDGR